MLMHHGIKGMHWGVRRYQNYDGTRIGSERRKSSDGSKNNENKKRGLSESQKESLFKPGKDGKASNAEKVTRAAKDSVGSTRNIVERSGKKSYKSDAPTLSDKELREKINRMELEQRYDRLNQERVSTGNQKALEILDYAGDVVSIGASAATILAVVWRLKH